MNLNESNRNQRREATPAVEWISLSSDGPIEANSETAADLPELNGTSVSKKTLPVSPETLTVLREAEKLIEDAERQLSAINCQAYLAQGLEPNRSRIVLGEEELYIQDVVASMFESGQYNPKTSITVGTAPSVTKLNTLDVRKFKSHAKTLNRSGLSADSLRRVLKVENPTLERLTKERECLVCKNKDVVTAGDTSREDKIEETPSLENTTIKEIAENVDSGLKRMSVHSGPNIAIRGEFLIQTSGVVDIKPNEPACRVTTTKHAPNVATFQVRHGYHARLDHSPLDLDSTPKSTVAPEQVDCHKSITRVGPTWKEADFAKNGPELQRCGNESYGTLDLNLLEDSLSLQEIFFNDRFSGKSKIIPSVDDLDVEDSSECLDWDLDAILKEPAILPEISSLLSQRQKFIRGVKNVIKDCDIFLGTRLFYSNFPLSSSTSARKRENNDESNRCTQKGSDLIMRKSGKHGTSKGANLIESIKNSEKMCNENQASECDYIPNLKRMGGLEEAEKTACQVDKNQATTTNNAVSSYSSKQSSCSSRITDDIQKSSIASVNKSSNRSNKESTDTISSTVEIGISSNSSQSRKFSSEVQNRSMDQIPSANNTNSSIQISIHSDKRPSSNFIENFRNVLTFGAHDEDDSHKQFGENGTCENPRIVQEENISANTESANADNQNSLRNRNMKYSRLKTATLVDNDSERDSFDEYSSRSEKRESIATMAIFDNKAESDQVQMDCSTKNEVGSKILENYLSIQDDSEEKLINSHLPEEVVSCTDSKNSLSCRDSLGLLHVSYFDQKQDDGSLRIEKEEVDESIDLDMEQKTRNRSSVTDNNISSPAMEYRIELRTTASSRANVTNSSTPEPRNPSAPTNGLSGVQKIDFLTSDDTKSSCGDNSLKRRSLLINLRRNSVEDSSRNGNVNLLELLEKYAVPRNGFRKRLLTSTVTEDARQSCDFIKSEESPESSLGTHSEGEIFISSSDTYSLGEIKKKYKNGLAN